MTKHGATPLTLGQDILYRTQSEGLFSTPESLPDSTRIVFISTPYTPNFIQSRELPACWFQVFAKEMHDLGYSSKWIRRRDTPSSLTRLRQDAHFESKSHQGVAWAVLRKDDSGLVLGMTFENSRPGIQVYEVADLDTQRALPELSTRPPMDRVRISLNRLHALQVSVRKITNRGREALPQYRVSLTVIKLGDEGPSI